jgi:eukaryotic-like serine/threonine-protein kinase
MIGRVLANRYRMDERIGGGGMALVYRAQDLELGRPVAVKVLRGQFGSDEEFVRRFRREAANAASLSHPSVVQIFDVGYDDELYFIVMELVEGQTLKELIVRQGPLPIPEAVRIASEILGALEHAHTNRIVHRDIKPHNILVGRDGHPKVTDFGIARATTTDTVTHTGSIMGSAHYFSPEQANGQPTGEKSDIYSMGVVLYEMVTGTVPFTGESPITVALKHIRDRVVPPSQLNSEVPVELDAIIRKALEKEPADRFESAAAMRRVLERFGVDHVAGRTHMPSGDFPTMDLRAMKRVKPKRVIAEEEDDEEQDEPRRRSRVWLWVAVVALVVVGALAGGYYALVRFMDAPEVAVPDLTNSHLTQAQEELRRLKLVPIVVNQSNNEIAAEHVIATDPPGKTVVKVGRDIVVKVSRGPEQRTLPDVVNTHVDEARARLESERFKIGDIVYQNASAPEGQVVGMSPAPLTPLPVGSTVKLVVSQGPLRVPQVLNMPLAEARQKLLAAKLAVGPTVYAPDATQPADTVLSSDPPPGTPVTAATPVSLTVSQGAPATGTAFTREIIVPGDMGQWRDVGIELVDTVAGVPNTRVLFSEKRQAGTRVPVSGSFFGQAFLRVAIDGTEQQRIALP